MLPYLIFACHTSKDPTPILTEDSSYIEVVVHPPQAQLWLNDQEVVGERFAVPKGRHTIKVERRGFATYTQEVYIDAPVQVLLQIELEPKQVPFRFSLDNSQERLLIRSGLAE